MRHAEHGTEAALGDKDVLSLNCLVRFEVEPRQTQVRLAFSHDRIFGSAADKVPALCGQSRQQTHPVELAIAEKDDLASLGRTLGNLG